MEEQESTKNQPPSVPSTPSNTHTVPIRIHKSTAKQLKAILVKINKKTYGKKVRADQIIAKAISLLTEVHLEEIKESTYDSKDRLEIEYKKFCQTNGNISKDEFLKKLLTAALPQVNQQTNKEIL